LVTYDPVVHAPIRRPSANDNVILVFILLPPDILIKINLFTLYSKL